jgi:quercetin dioxygenase-like cupin family protein
VPAAETRLRALGVEPHAWSNGPGDRYAAHEHGFTKLLVCAEGSITFLVGDAGEPVELVAGRGFVLPAGMRHAAIVGPDGCTCLEGHRG